MSELSKAQLNVEQLAALAFYCSPDNPFEDTTMPDPEFWVEDGHLVVDGNYLCSDGEWGPYAGFKS